jgi:hypothetical protein
MHKKYGADLFIKSPLKSRESLPLKYRSFGLPWFLSNVRLLNVGDPTIPFLVALGPQMKVMKMMGMLPNRIAYMLQ